MVKALVFLLFICMFNQVFASGTAFIDGKKINTKQDLHNVLSKELKFPKYYGNTMDSLYDILSTDFSGNTFIRVKHLNQLKNRFGTEFTETFLQTISKSSEDNQRIIIIIE